MNGGADNLTFCFAGLAQLSPSQKVLLYGLALLVVLIAGYIGLQWIRRRATHDAGGAGSAGFDLATLERLRREGQLTDEQFKTLRRHSLGIEQKLSQKPDSSSSAPARGDDDKEDSDPIG